MQQPLMPSYLILNIWTDLQRIFSRGDMESNGKCVDRNGEFVEYETGPIIWGEPEPMDNMHSIS